MTKILVVIARWVLQKVGLLLVILAILLIGWWAKSEWNRLAEDAERLSRKESILRGMEEDLAQMDEIILEQQQKWSQLRQERLKELFSLEQVASAARQKAEAAGREYRRASQRVGLWESGAPMLPKNRGRVIKEKALWEKYILLGRAARSAEAVRDTFKSKSGASPEELRMLEDKRRKEAEAADIREMVEADRARMEADPGQRFLAACREQLPTALWILMAIVLTPIAIKALFYYVLAPLASKLPPIRVLPGEGKAPLPVSTPSAVSLSFDIEEGEEILVHSSFLQSSGLLSENRTQWFLNARIPFSSIASGMCILTRIRPGSEGATRVVLSSQDDAFGEIGVLEIPEGCGMVIHPRSLAGIVKARDTPVHISRHWRLGNLHAWLTLQLRYLVFHGPCKIVLKGCRGVRAETPDAAMPRMINQAASIGFSANLEYKTTRCETFISYLRGKNELLNDLFSGGPGMFVYEEMPAGGRKTGLTGRGLEGLVDSVLKVFGV